MEAHRVNSILSFFFKYRGELLYVILMFDTITGNLATSQGCAIGTTVVQLHIDTL